MSRGTLYKTLERMEAKGLVSWEAEDGPPERGGHPRRRFGLTATGAAELREAQEALLRMREGLEGILGESGPWASGAR